MSFSARLKKARIEKGLSQTELGKKVQVHYTQIGRYEQKGVKPSSEVLAKMANVLGVSTDFLMNGSSEQLAGAALTDKKLLNQFISVELLPKDKKAVVIELIDAFLLKCDIQQRYVK